ncbi:MAG: RHS repeat-associated core domain-containing protein [Deltaproteobacteria bacterium]|nr:RHS repeat-associated core domain-containing protein [Deltaproteobacteria bacterium]
MFRAVDPDHAPAALTDLFGTTINTNLGWRNSLYWDSRSWVRARAIDVNFGGGAWRLARVIHWMHRSHAIDQATGVIATVQEPGQYRTWYAYLNQEYAFYLGDDGTALPSTIARFVPSGSSTQEQVTRYTWNSLGHVATVTDPQNRQMAFAYDSNGIDPLFVDHRTSTSPVQYQRVSAYSNFVRHRPTSVTDAAGPTTVYQYNCRGQVLSRMRPGGAVTTYTYDSPSSNANPPCSGTEGRLVSVSGPGGTVSLSTYTNRNLPRVVTDLNGLAKTYTFDALDRVTRVDLPDGSHNAVTYVQRDDQGQPRLDAGVPVPGLEPTQFTDRGGQITTRSYDRAQRLIYNNDPNGHVTRYNYCCGSGLSSISDSLAHQTTWVRDDTLSGRLDNRPVKMIRADGTTVAYEYDRAGRLSAETNGQLDGDPSEPGYRAVYEYNLDATVGNVEVSAGGETYGRVYGYDPFFQRLTSVFHTQNTGGTYSASFDFSLTYRALGASGAGQVEQIQGVLPNSTIVYGYDALGRRVSRTMGNTQWAVRLDAADRLDHVDHTVGGATRTLDYHYPVGSALAHPNSVDYPVILGTTQRAHSTFGYYGTDQFRRLQAYSHVDRDGATLENSSLEYTVPGRISWKLFDGAWTNYTYDPAGQLTDFVRWEDNGQAWEYRDWAHYGYDPQGNRDVATVFAPWHSSGTFSWYTNYDWGDRPYHRSDSDNYGVALVPDHRGNVADDGIFIYQWNHFGQLKSVNVWGQITSFAYDGVGRLASWTTGAVTHYFVWDGQQLVQERDSTTNVLREVFPEGFGQGGHRLYYLRDQLGSVIGLLDETGHRVRSYRYDPWGGRSSTFVAPGFEAYDSPIGFAGYLVHPDSGLHFTPTRVYAPNIGRWLSRDPLGHRDAVDGRNLYAYAANDPVNGRDSTGQYLDMLIDAGFIAYDVSNIVGDFASGNCGSINGHLGDLGLDVLGAAIPGVTGLGAARRVGSGAEHVLGHLGRGGDDLVDVYRGVSAGHPNPRVWREAQQGAARPIGGRGAHSDPARHASGRTHSTFVSWSTDPQVALDFATHSGTSEGVILHDTLPRSVVEQLMNPSGIPGERELLRGSSSGATVWRVNPGDYGL